MNKIASLFLIIIIAPFIAGLYGMAHDQLTYTISPEYFIRFKFEQFHLTQNIPDRLNVLKVGWMATWWMGLPIGLILGLVGLVHHNGKEMFVVTIKAFLITMVVAFVTGLIGLAYGEIFLAKHPPDWYYPENLRDIESFVSVGSMHNFSYLGGLTGLVAGIIYSIRISIRNKNISVH